MPEVLAYFDFDCLEFLRFVHRFGGMKIEAPTPSKLQDTIRDTIIYDRVSKAEDVDAEVIHLAEHYQITNRRVEQIYESTRDKLAVMDKKSGMDSGRILAEALGRDENDN